MFGRAGGRGRDCGFRGAEKGYSVGCVCACVLGRGGGCGFRGAEKGYFGGWVGVFGEGEGEGKGWRLWVQG